MRALALALFSASLFACVSDTPTSPDAGKQTGEEGGPCFSDFTCKTGLVCMLGPNVCGKAEAGAGDSGGGDTGSTNDAGADSGDSGATCIGQTVAWWQGESSPADHFNSLNFMWVNGMSYPAGEVKLGFGVGSGAFLKQTTGILGGLGKLTIELWLQFAQAPGAVATILKYAAGDGTPLISVEMPAGMTNINVTIAGVGTAATGPMNPMVFHHVGLVFNSGALQVWTDGKFVATSTGNATLPASASNAVLSLGANSDGTGGFVGVIDELAMYRNALTTTDLDTIRMAGANGICRVQ